MKIGEFFGKLLMTRCAHSDRIKGFAIGEEIDAKNRTADETRRKVV
jgi:hypothetical protein